MSPRSRAGSKRVALAEAPKQRWRVAQNGRSLYSMEGEKASIKDTYLGALETVELAQAVVAEHNARVEREGADA